MYCFPKGISLIKQIGGRHPSTGVIIIIQNGLHKTFILHLGGLIGCVDLRFGEVQSALATSKEDAMLFL